MPKSKEKLYLLRAVWQDDNNEYRNRVIHTTANSVEEMFKVLASEHPEWDITDDYTTIGEINGAYTSVTVFETVSMDDRSWRKWVHKRQAKRIKEIAAEERSRDMAELRRIAEKHGISALEVLAAVAEK